MKNLILLPLLCLFFANSFAQQLPRWNTEYDNKNATTDWLLNNKSAKAEIYQSHNGKDIILYNGLVKRSFRIAPDVACIDYKNLINGQQLLRAVKPEAMVNINGKDYYVGGLYGQTENAYLLPQWIESFKKGDSVFNYVSYNIDDIKLILDWKTDFWTANKQAPTGKVLSFKYQSSLNELKGIDVYVRYELYDGIPLINKSVEIKNNTTGSVTINRVINEILAVVEEESAVVGKPEQMKKPAGIYIETNYAYNNSMQYPLSDQTTHWKIDKSYTSQVNYDFNTPCLLEVYPEKVSDVTLLPNETFKSLRTNELLMDSYDRERRGLAIKKMYRTIAPWTTSNPIFMHLVSKDDKQVYTAIDQCAATGYEALILSFGSNLNIEENTTENHNRWKAIADYAHSKGVKIGGYTLFSSRTIAPETDVISAETGKPGGAFFGNAPCFASEWGQKYYQAIIDFFKNTGFDILEMDGPYPGDVCASTTHPGHKGLDDSQWAQMNMQKSLFHWMNENGVYVNAPDWYFLDGANKIALGYREVNFALSREQQRILNRQNIFDGTWDKTPSMGWGFVPLTAYHGGKADAVLEPLNDHLNDYRALMIQYYGAGIQACYRGPRLYDTEETKQTVIAVIDWYKKYRDILNADIIHLRRADGRDWDGILHADPNLKERGFVMLYNPTKEKITRTIKLPLYYTGLTDNATISEKDSSPRNYKLNRDFSADLTFSIEPDSYTWFVIRE
ncbi:alpha-galactosidase [Dysgonomonas sp. ZJ279]|uniref:alpha-galactosidase n=1 Tax=Dysgonomonas sp. ZJ279 TaxID=2709796 RepID=UPI0016265FF8|nr:alpha-galactosidase [Dysgonomonas sp. ZJ279]